MHTQAENDAMLRAVELATSRLGRTGANPTVGCVLLDRAQRVVGEGCHQRAGEPHAEIVALAAAGGRAAGGTAVVTLEPCNHTGRTGPCTEALRAAGIARVVYAVADPWLPAAGGAAALAAAGIEVVGGVLASEAGWANRFWLKNVTRARPWVTWKFGATLDGRIAAPDGTSRWITSAQARADAHRLRSTHDAVLVGAGTVRADDPHLGVRHGIGGRPPIRVVMASGSAGLPFAARVFDGTARTVLAVPDTYPDIEAPPNVELLAVKASDGRLAPDALLAGLLDLGIRSVLLEGGPVAASGFLTAGCVDEIVGYIAPALLGAGPGAVADVGVTTISEALRWEFRDCVRVGPDLRISAAPAGAGGAGGAAFAGADRGPAADRGRWLP
ncbi:diaminohydroxyphosphoribosylaminopyrimidine deaminase/5-amino-6-(5-phosphoribosylamino)uracil reductase [Kitasatospora sp. GAS204A]|uniref:bifunctional diaminohydroxyphosphoribosylaminopyrimidine deaminase/5-amino-6-(5-phosphoribosylamino)uracil reductase RibD n=1 Tax=unclassified Kitasatospora TaxID=2633591 RepID=UPI002476EAFC|nr:bifunctional diaminohydroxyphosphoribosylaminopyrimidine deaminase/5-amino-6-(5-phosphoribosylamino)uracil reductase RibD [Kitasatospora sp. GAS204B]MDH6117924.1 diaminohydroxyphosphoribosylaminopyrimidine deaminase/5-amino-6-(5-phosphoribosylamino)uracil reductase [Kitasatospora sp. GAS204B]